MIKTLSTYDVAYELQQDKNADRTHEEAIALAEYYENLEEEIGEPIELDVVAIRCDWSSYTLEELADENMYGEYGEDEEEVLQYVKDNTQVIEVQGDYLIIDF